MPNLKRSLAAASLGTTLLNGCDGQPSNDARFIHAVTELCPRSSDCMTVDPDQLSPSELAARKFRERLEALMHACNGTEVNVIKSESEELRRAAQELMAKDRGEQDNPDRIYTPAEATLGWYTATFPECAGVKPVLNAR